MATRNVTAIFLHERGIRLKKTPPIDTPRYGDDKAVLLSTDEHRINIDGSAPVWVATVEKVKDIEAQIRCKMNELRELHAAHLKPRFDTDKEVEEQEIERRATEIKGLFRKGDVAIRQLLDKQGDYRDLPADEQKLLNNVQISLVTALSERSKEFQEQHRKYALEVQKQRRRINRLTNNNFKQDEEAERREEMLQKYHDKGFTQEQIDTLLINEQMSIERDRELQNIYHNITDLHSMFQDLNALVIDQGTLLDRIDHNVEETKEQIKKATRELEATAEYARKSKFVLIVMILVALIILLLLALVLKILI